LDLAWDRIGICVMYFGRLCVGLFTAKPLAGPECYRNIRSYPVDAVSVMKINSTIGNHFEFNWKEHLCRINRIFEKRFWQLLSQP